MSTPRRIAQRRSSSSFSLSAGTLTATPGRLMPLLLETGPPTTTSVDHLDVVDVDRAQGDLAVVDQQGVARVDVLGQALEGRGADLLGARNVLGGDRERVTDRQEVRTVDEAAQADLRALQVGHDGHGLAELSPAALRTFS